MAIRTARKKALSGSAKARSPAMTTTSEALTSSRRVMRELSSVAIIMTPYYPESPGLPAPLGASVSAEPILRGSEWAFW